MAKRKVLTREDILIGLAARCERAAGPDRDLDRDIHRALFPDDTGEPPFYTGELAAALTMFPDRSPRKIAAAALCAAATEAA